MGLISKKSLSGERDKTIRVGVKYCGGCNPYIDRDSLTRGLEQKLKKYGYSLEYFDFSKCSLVVVVNGCPVGCGEIPKGKNIILVHGEELEWEKVSEIALPERIARRVLEVMLGKEAYQKMLSDKP